MESDFFFLMSFDEKKKGRKKQNPKHFEWMAGM